MGYLFMQMFWLLLAAALGLLIGRLIWGRRDELEQCLGHCRSLSSQLERIRGELKQCRDREEHARSDAENRAAELQSTQERNSVLHSDLEQARSELKGAREELESIRIAGEATASELERTKGEGDRLRSELEQARSELKGCQDELGNARDVVETAGVELEEARAELKGCLQELESTRKSTEEAAAAQQSAEEERDGLRSELKQARSALEASRKEPAETTPPVQMQTLAGAGTNATAEEEEPAPDDWKPTLLSAPRGEKDDLMRIKGIGPKIEELLNDLGVYHFSQIAAFTQENIAWINSHLKFKGRIERENWIGQAKQLAARQ